MYQQGGKNSCLTTAAIVTFTISMVYFVLSTDDVLNYNFFVSQGD
jgi:hypothetical protein